MKHHATPSALLLLPARVRLRDNTQGTAELALSHAAHAVVSAMWWDQLMKG